MFLLLASLIVVASARRGRHRPGGGIFGFDLSSSNITALTDTISGCTSRLEVSFATLMEFLLEVVANVTAT